MTTKKANVNIDADSSTPDILEVGQKVLIRTVTMNHIGRIAGVGDRYIVLEDGGWLADSGRFGECLASGKVNEFERAPGRFLVAAGAIVDVFPWAHAIPERTI